ncbi:gluconokinase [Nakamurella leprariae]|uniref:Gluconokinase n=1 Tax=Nakamurella leprariae TaxID=2803911 RepID=A0A938YC79_9ACTN|nr:gluconokinase [Nakamurella leprariae]
MGVSGTGKTTLATGLAERFGWVFQEGDDLHPPANVAKMSSGQPLTDDDRWPWLDRVAVWIKDQLANGRSGVITCSALRRVYRDRLRRSGVVFVLLHGSREQITDRLAARRGHYMPLSLLNSQLATLELPGADEQAVIVPLGGTPEQELDAALDGLRQAGITVPD